MQRVKHGRGHSTRTIKAKTLYKQLDESMELQDLEGQGPCGCGALSEARMLLTGPIAFYVNPLVTFTI